MIKKIIVSLGLLFSLASFAQEGTSSPYSFYGIGDVKFKGTAENRAMGGLSVFPDSTHINLQNPAQFASLLLTNFSVGGTYANTKLKTSAQEEKARRTTLDYLAVGIPLKKFGFGFGLIPYSSVGYKIEKLATETDQVTKKYNGLGGINKVFFGLGYKINKQFNIGADVQYNFGNIQTKSLLSVTGVQFGSREVNASDISGVNFDFGLTYQNKINKKQSIFASLLYSPEAKLSSKNERNLATVQFYNLGGETVVDQVDVDVNDTKLVLPSKWVFGTGFGEVKKWLVGGEITLQNSSKLGNRFDDIDGVTFENSVKYSLGGYFVPNYNSYSGYFKKVTYRGGLRYETTGLVKDGQSIKDVAATLGVGLPLGFSSINLGLEYGKRGTTSNGLIQENYLNISIGLSFSDKWFVKRKYD